MSKSKARIKVLLVDDHPVVRRGIAACLNQHEQIELVGEAGDGREALAKARQLLPDVVITDVAMPVMNGAKLTKALAKALPATRVLVLSVHHTPDTVRRMVEAGATGYMHKESPPEELIRGILQVARGEPSFSESIAPMILNQSGHGQSDGEKALTDNEREVLIRIAEGLGNKEIAAAHELDLRTVEKLRKGAMRKLDIHSVPGLTKHALAQGWVGLRDELKVSG